MRILKTLHWSRRRSGSGVADIHSQPAHDNNNGVTIDNLETKDTRENQTGPDEMWNPGMTPGHHRELPVDVPDTLLQQAYAHKVIKENTSNLPKQKPPRLPPPRINTRSASETIQPQKIPDKPIDIETASPKVKFEKISGNISPSDVDKSAVRIIEITLRNNDKNGLRNSNRKSIFVPDGKESNVDVDSNTEYDYPFAKEDYPTMLKTCSDTSASPRSSSGRSGSTAALDVSLILPEKEDKNFNKDEKSSSYDAQKIDFGSPCQPHVFNLSKDTSISFDNPTYEMGIDHHQNVLIRSDEINDFSRFHSNDNKNKSSGKKLIKSPKKVINDEALLGIGSASTENLLTEDTTDFISLESRNKKKKKQISSGYSTLKSQIDFSEGDSSFLPFNSDITFREVAVDVPADFVPVEKSHPTYPPTRRADKKLPINKEDKTLEISAEASSDVTKGTKRIKAGLNGVKPAIPPRDQKRAPARPPKDNLRLSNRNNNFEINENINSANDSIQQPQPTPQQLHSIKKYQEQFRQRKDHEERQEYLNQSLRGSRKLHALESHKTNLGGMENLAYTQDELTPPSSARKEPTSKDVEELSKILTYGEVVAILERLEIQLRNLSGALDISGPGVEAELEAVRTLLVQKRFATALATHHALRSRLRGRKIPKHYDDDSSNLNRDCVEVLEEWQTSNVKSSENMALIEELTRLLTSDEIEGLLLAHDSIISYVDGVQRKQSPSSSLPSHSPSPTSSIRDFRSIENFKLIKIDKTHEPLGATIRNEGDAVIIGRVVRGGAAFKTGLFNEGDEVLEVNGVEMRGKNVNEVCDVLASMTGSLTFLVLPVSSNHRNIVDNPKLEENHDGDKQEENAPIVHVRAYFDYDPEEDLFIPCRELGVGFQKGDVLHVISQDDPNWWQAYRDGEDDQTLAGLIPSRSFQHQRESMKQTIAGGKSTIRGTKKSSTLLCTKKNPKKKKKRSKFGANMNEDGYPLYSTATIDDYDSEEVLTYEEVSLYYPLSSDKRPIVLIGPPNIGRHELRQRLMQDSERFAAAIPHTSRPRKGSEVDGQDYHFISRSQFESDILCRKFVEHGEYERAYYGTSVEAIRTVVNSGKICVLNLHPQSLKILRNSDLKPYVVFVAPPSLEKLRQKRIRNNESFKEEELKDIIEKAREMEDKYGHLFDMIIINNDHDRTYNQLLTEINSLECEPQWVPATWVQ